MVAAPHLHPLGVVAANFTDPAHERTIYIAAGGLVLLGIVLLVGTIVWWRGTKGEHASLAPLELMGQRSWEKAPFTDRVRRLESVRVRSEGDPVEPVPNPSEEIDLDELLRSFQPGFDDLRDEPPLLVDAVPESATVLGDDAKPVVATGGVVPDDASPAAHADPPSADADVDVDAAAGIADAGDIIVDAVAPDPEANVDAGDVAPDAEPAAGIDPHADIDSDVDIHSDSDIGARHNADHDALLAGGATDS